jgi:hypothetical protein
MMSSCPSISRQMSQLRHLPNAFDGLHKACQMLVDRIAQAFHRASHKMYLAGHWADGRNGRHGLEVAEGAVDR